ncbi:hypothetical protein JCM3765_003635 [Sporobolomyces pararoseus]
MPRYSTASASENDDSDYPPSRLPPSTSSENRLNSTPRFQLPFNNKNHSTPASSSSEDENQDDNSEEEEAWDEVDIPPNNQQVESSTSQNPTAGGGGNEGKVQNGGRDIEIVIRKAGEKNQSLQDSKNKKKSTALTPQERQLRQERHKVHVISLLSMGLLRNQWLNDKELQARLISQLPPQLHASLVSITRERYPNSRDRSRLFESFLKDLISWWYQTFKILKGRELKRKSLNQVEKELKSWQQEFEKLNNNNSKKSKESKKGKGKQIDPSLDYKQFPWEETEILSYEKRLKRLKTQSSSSSSSQPLVRQFGTSSSTWEPLSSPLNSLYASVSNMKGSKDLSVQLLVALLRGLDVPCRLVISLQGMEWRSDSASGLKKPTTKQTKGKEKDNGVETIELNTTTTDEEDDWQDGRGKLNYKVPKVNLRKSGVGTGKKKMANWEKEKMLMRSPSPDEEELNQPPSQWIEVYSRYLKEWITLDPIRKLVRCKTKMEPNGKAKGSGNTLVYVVGFEEDGSAHDITPRYTKSFNNQTVKLRVPTSSKTKKENQGKDWFQKLLEPWGRKFELNRDRIEREELWTSGKRNEPFPTSFGGFKNHPNFVLEQHLHRDEALIPGTKPLGLFKGTTQVFPRSSVIVVKSLENWYRIGRSIKPGEIPRKFVKGRTVTINSKRREELIKLDGGEVDDQPLYSQDQTELYVPDPVVDGKVPKNSFGNIDLFVPTMLPEGAVHLPSKLAVKCAKMLQIDFAEAIIGFEFRQRRATPTMSGIVVAKEHSETLREAIANLEQQSLEKTLAQQQDRVLKRWKKLITGLRIRQRLQGQFKDVESGIVGEAATNTSAIVSRNGSKSGTPRIDSTTSASNSPAPELRTAKQKKKQTPSSSIRKRSSSRRSPSSSPSNSSSGSSPPPPRKKKRQSTTTTTTSSSSVTRSTRSTRTTRASMKQSQPLQEEDNDRSLVIKLPATPSISANEEVQEGSSSRRRPTRASAVKARLNLSELDREEEEEEEEEEGKNREEIVEGPLGGGEEPGLEQQGEEREEEIEFEQNGKGPETKALDTVGENGTKAAEELGDDDGNEDEFGFEYESD